MALKRLIVRPWPATRPIIALALLLGLALLAIPATATAAPTLTFTPNAAPRGAEVALTGSGFAPNAPLKIIVEPAPGQRGDFGGVTTAADGTFRFTFTVPPGVAPGMVDFVVVSAADGQELARATFTITDAPPVGPRVEVSPRSGSVGTRFTVTGRDFPAGAELVYGIDVDRQPVVLGQIRITADGTFASSFDSAAIPPGEYELVVTTGPNVRPLALARFAVTAADAPGLPNTGAGGRATWFPASLALAAGLGLAGTLLAVGRARRRDSR